MAGILAGAFQGPLLTPTVLNLEYLTLFRGPGQTFPLVVYISGAVLCIQYCTLLYRVCTCL